jgi:hypothetical protein
MPSWRGSFTFCTFAFGRGGSGEVRTEPTVSIPQAADQIGQVKCGERSRSVKPVVVSRLPAAKHGRNDRASSTSRLAPRTDPPAFGSDHHIRRAVSSALTDRDGHSLVHFRGRQLFDQREHL